MNYKNKFTLVGKFAWDPEVRSMVNGDAVCRCKVKTMRTVGAREIWDYVPVTGWREIAEELGRGRKDGQVGVKGHLTTWKDKEGKWVTDIVADEVRYPTDDDTPF
jgi:single-stranded DNA-binding protein